MKREHQITLKPSQVAYRVLCAGCGEPMHIIFDVKEGATPPDEKALIEMVVFYCDGCEKARAAKVE